MIKRFRSTVEPLSPPMQTAIESLLGSDGSSAVLTSTPSSSSPLHVVVVGGGASGLSCALALARSGVRVTVLEKAASVGGHAAHAEVFGGHRINPAFGAFQPQQWPNAWRLFEELGVEVVKNCDTAAEFATRYARDGHAI